MTNNQQRGSLSAIVTYLDKPNLVVQATLNEDEDGEPYLGIIQRIPMGKLPENTLKFPYDLRIDEINSNMLCDGQLPFFLCIEDVQSWYQLYKEIDEIIGTIYEITQCYINIQMPELNTLPASAPIYLTVSTPITLIADKDKMVKQFKEIWPKIHEAIAMFVTEHKQRLSNEPRC